MTNNSIIKLLARLWLLFICLIPIGLNAGTIQSVFEKTPDTLIQTKLDSLAIISADTVLYSDTIIVDTIITTSISGDTVIDEAIGRTKFDSKVERYAIDSIVQDIANRKIFLFGEAVINYEDITLKANYIEVDLNTNTVFASGIKDSTGKLRGLPEFTQGDQTFKSNTMTYNFDSKKGFISNVLTEDGNGFLHGTTVKKLDDNTINILHGEYTTCNLEEDPHFGFKFKKSRVIPDSKIVTGPAYMEIEGMPTPLGLPFGFFPNKSGQTSGIRIPTYGEYTNRGFFLENGGYYWAINDYMDLDLLGDIYSRGGWAIKPRFRYKKRYKFSGDFNLGYAVNIVGTKGAPDYSKSTDFKIRWSHRQDPKARPNSTFSADVNIVSGNYVKYNVVSTQAFLSNEFQSSVAYQKNWNSKYFLTLNASHSQNTKTHIVNVSLPEMTFTVNRFYPLRGKSKKKRFYEDLSVSYTMNLRNTISTTDSVLFDKVTLEQNMQAGASHKIPISLPIKVLKYFTLSNSINFTDRMYSRSIRKYWENDTTIVAGDTLDPGERIDTVPGFRNSYNYSISSSLSTKLFGIVAFKKGPLRAIRHVLTPSVSFSYTPDFGAAKYGYYGTYVDGDGREISYSHFEGSLYGSPPGQKSGRIGISLGNNLEIKVPSRKDTITGLRKIKLIESFSISGNYDLSRDSLNMSMITMSGRTTLWKNLNIQYGSVWDPYAADSAGSRINKYEWDVNRRLLRLDNTSWRLSFGFELGDKDFNKEKKPENATDDEMNEIESNPDDYVNWNIPWSLNFNYNFTYTNNLDYINYIKVPTETIVQTLSFAGQINITPKWKFTFNSGWDFTQNKLSYTSINLYRDLHCWEMRFSWIPLGVRQSWNFSINVKASILQDLKLNKKKDFRDY
ncbi:MAG TPA: putative LPS assembly protein LptD [Bacteroidales bacterium]|nr:hypothetical protein [Bacteroidota bacterium]HJN05461.1 putative LPS assembly protein LptD [Bacteroidales bacterium]